MKKVKVIGMIGLISIIWGYLWVSMKVGLQDIPPFFFTTLRLFIGALVLITVLIIRRKPILPKGNEWRRFFALGMLMCVGYYALCTYGIQFVDSGISSVLVYTMPIIVSILAHFFLNERLNWLKGFGLLVGAAGLATIIAPKLLHLSWNLALFGEIVIVVSAFFWSSANVYTKKIGRDHDKIKMTLWQLIDGGIILLIISLLKEHHEIAHLSIHMPSMLALLYSSILGTAVAFVGWNWVLGNIEASIASISLMSVPILGLIFGAIQLHEAITQNVIIGAIFVCLGILFTSLPKKKPMKG